MQPGDVERTWADISDTTIDFNFIPKTDVEAGVIEFVNWYRSYYKV